MKVIRMTWVIVDVAWWVFTK